MQTGNGSVSSQFGHWSANNSKQMLIDKKDIDHEKQKQGQGEAEEEEGSRNPYDFASGFIG